MELRPYLNAAIVLECLTVFQQLACEVEHLLVCRASNVILEDFSFHGLDGLGLLYLEGYRLKPAFQ